MFSKLAIVASLALLAVATPTPGGGESSTFCCGTVKTYDEAQNEGILGLINVAAEDIGKNVGVDCTVCFLVCSSYTPQLTFISLVYQRPQQPVRWN